MLFDKAVLVQRVIEAAEPRVSVISSAPAPNHALAPAADAKARIAAIINHPEALGRRALAERLAFSSDLPVEQAASILAAAPREAAAHGLPASSATAAGPVLDYNAMWSKVIERANASVRARKQGLAG